MTPPMTDDLVGRLRSYADTCTGLEPRRIITEAADHIAGTGKLVARIEALEAALTAARHYVGWAFDGEVAAPQALDAIDDIAKAALTPEPPHAD